MAQPSLALSQGTPEWSLAVDIIIVGILISGIAIGIGHALRSRRIFNFGTEELAQAVVNAAMLGALFAWVGSVDAITLGWADNSKLSCPALSAAAEHVANAPLFFCRCALENIRELSIPLITSLSSLSYKLGWLSGMTLSLNVVTATPFASFSDTATSYASWANSFSALLSAAELNFQALSIISSLAFSFFLPAGLLLRMFFATRKLGGAIMAGAIGLYIVYPIALSTLLASANATAILATSKDAVQSALNSFAAVPLIDLGKSAAVSDLISNLSGGDISSAAVMPYSALAAARASLELSLLIFPLLSLLLTAVAVRELYLLLSSEFNLNLFEMV